MTGKVTCKRWYCSSGEIHEYTHLLEETRRQAVDRLVQNATVMGGNAVLMMRFDSSEIGQTMSEIVAYGTAAVIEPLPAERRLLRISVLVFGGIMLAAAAFGAIAGWRLAAVIPLAVWGAICAGGLLFERWRYQPLAHGRPDHGWQATPERFVDPETAGWLRYS